MNPPDTENFTALCREAATKFIQTALIVDNEAGFGFPSASSTPKMAIKQAKPTIGAKTKPPRAPAEHAQASIEENDDSHYLDVKSLSDAFLQKGIVCGIYRPNPGEDMVDETIKAASTADIVIIDWQLETRNSTKAKQVIAELLKKDIETGPRLRSIAVYTGQKGLEQLAEELLSHIKEIEGISGFKLVPNDSSILIGPHARIVFINKRGISNPVNGDRAAGETELPGVLLDEYAQLAQGILPATAMAAIADIRRATPHLLTVFNQKLDGAYVGHRAMIPVAEDAETFLRRLISEEMDTVIETAGTVPRFGGKPAVDAWLDNLKNNGHSFEDSNKRQIDIELIKEVLEHVSENPERYENSIIKMLKEKLQGSGEKNKDLFGQFATLFYTDSDSEENALFEFSRLDHLKRETNSRTRLDSGWLPVLGLGTIIKPIFDEQGKEPTELEQNQLLLSVQPRCDSVRLPHENGRKFPFLILSPAESRFQFIIQSDGSDTTYHGKPFPYNLVMFTFKPASEKDQTIKATEEGEQFIFTAKTGEKFAWVADIKDMQAQKIAGQLGARAASVGNDEHEWLRKKG